MHLRTVPSRGPLMPVLTQPKSENNLNPTHFKPSTGVVPAQPELNSVGLRVCQSRPCVHSEQAPLVAFILVSLVSCTCTLQQPSATWCPQMELPVRLSSEWKSTHSAHILSVYVYMCIYVNINHMFWIFLSL